jgi:hypothetical protein
MSSVLMFIGCSTFNTDSLNQLVQSDRHILILINKSDLDAKTSKVSKLYSSDKTLNKVIDIKIVDTDIPQDFDDLISKNKSDWLDILFADSFNYDRIYYIKYTQTAPRSSFDRTGKRPQGPGYVVQPFILSTLGNNYHYWAKSPKDLFRLVLEHTVDPKFNYETIDKRTCQSDLKALLKKHFETSYIGGNNLPRLLMESENIVKYDKGVVDYVLSNMSDSWREPFYVSRLYFYKKTVIENINDLSSYRKLLDWLEGHINRRESEISSALKNFPELKVSSNLEGQYLDSLLVNINTTKDNLYSHIVNEGWTYLSPLSITVEQVSPRLISINLTIELSIDEYHSVEDMYATETGWMFLIFPSSIVDKLKAKIIYDGYWNRYSLKINKKGSPESITIYGHTDRSDPDLFKNIVIAATSGNEYLHEMLLKQYNIQYDSKILYANEVNSTNVILEDCLNEHAYGWHKIQIGDEVRTMTGQPTKNYYLHSFFNIP